jgi:hypothetical protein
VADGVSRSQRQPKPRHPLPPRHRLLHNRGISVCTAAGSISASRTCFRGQTSGTNKNPPPVSSVEPSVRVGGDDREGLRCPRQTSWSSRDRCHTGDQAPRRPSRRAWAPASGGLSPQSAPVQCTGSETVRLILGLKDSDSGHGQVRRPR